MLDVLSITWVVTGLIGPDIVALVAGAVGRRWVFLGLLPLVIAAGALVGWPCGTSRDPPVRGQPPCRTWPCWEWWPALAR